MQKTRAFVVTNWNIDCDYAALVQAGQIRYVAYGHETCPSTGRAHHQAFCYFHNPRSSAGRALATIGKMFGPIACNVLPMRGSLLENEAYCSKEGTLTEFGDKPAPGARGDIDAVVKQIQAGETTADAVCMENPEFFHKYGRTLDRVEAVSLRARWRTEMTEGIWITGPPGSGKTHMAFEGYTPDTHYVKNVNEDWWDGYKGHPIVVINEFRGQIPFSELLDLVDKWPKTVKWRCRESVPFLATKLIVTSVKTPKEVYRRQVDDEPWGQFDRRFKVITLGPR